VTPGDTIAAVATPPGIGGIGVVRVSGPAVRTIAPPLLGDLPAPRHAAFRGFRDADATEIDRGLALYFPAPFSFTGEDVLELHAHGSPVVLELLLKRVVDLGARIARPGEFSERAFLNGKIDLAQAEAIADLVNASSEAAARSAARSLAGALSAEVHGLVEELAALRTYVEAAIDFPEEEIDFLEDARVREELAGIRAHLAQVLRNAKQGALLQAGMTLVLVGPPNSGKSSVLNALAREETAIVSPTPGTTRDIVRAHIAIDGLPVHVLDTAGLREGGEAIEQEGMTRARAAMTRADRVLVVLDDSEPARTPESLLAHVPSTTPRTVIYNKIDLSARPAGEFQTPEGEMVAVSAKTGAGLDSLRAHLKRCMGYQPAGEGSFIARRRHLEALERARGCLDAAAAHAQARAGELLADELRQAQQALAEITGEFTTEDLLARIFASFCIGK
jgi:tRNA modification GTPase